MKKEVSDEELVYKIQKFNDKEAMNLLLFRYEKNNKKIVRGRLRRVGNFYYDYDEFYQIVRFTTLRVIETYDDKKGDFYNYWSSAINRVISTELHKLGRKLSGIEVNQIYVFNEEDADYMETFTSDEDLFIRQFNAKCELERVKSISDEFLTLEEKTILAYRMVGYSYEEIAKKTKSTPKRVDNIMLLIRKKLKRYL